MRTHLPFRVGIFIDVQNVYHCVREVFGYSRINYQALKDHLAVDGQLLTLCAFTALVPDGDGQEAFLNALGHMGYRVVARPMKRLPDGSLKSPVDMVMAIEVLSTAPYLDEVVLVTGDSDFVPLVDHLCRMGKLVKVIGPDRLTAPELIRACHTFLHLSQVPGIFEFPEDEGAS